MIINKESLRQRDFWEQKGYLLPEYDREEMIRHTRSAPLWLHVGGGNIFRVFIAQLAEQLLNAGQTDRGICVCSSAGTVLSVYRPMDNYTLGITLHEDGHVTKRISGAVADSLILDGDGADLERLRQIAAAPSLQLMSFTITEKGYRITDAQGGMLPEVMKDMSGGPARPAHTMGRIAALTLERYRAGAYPLALVSMDNHAHNGDKLKAAILAYGRAWEAAGFAPAGFCDYLSDEQSLSFPWTMIDKITPSPDDAVGRMLAADGLRVEDLSVSERGKRACVFANGEETGYLVIEDAFPNGRPPLEQAGVLFTDRATVDLVEQMKVCTCLNPLHTALAIFGCLFGYPFIREEMKDPLLVALIRRIGYTEGLPVVKDPGILHPKDFLDTVLERRFPNPYVPDRPWRIATDTSQKLPIRFGKTLGAYVGDPERDPKDLVAIPLVFAGYLRYLLGVDDQGEAMTCAADPRLEDLQCLLQGIRLGDQVLPEEALAGVLSDETLFGCNLYQIGLGARVQGFFLEMIAGPGAVRRTLEKYLKDVNRKSYREELKDESE